MEGRSVDTGPASLVVPLSQKQIDAADRLHREHLPGWRRVKEVLYVLGQQFPSHTETASVTPKAASLNILYGTNVRAVGAMVRHVARIFADVGPTPGAGVVDRLARLEGLKGGSRRFLSFASKYCHFFVDAERFPILDSRAGEALTLHLGHANRCVLTGGPDDYPNYVRTVDGLLGAAGLRCGYATLDHYLWLRGERTRWTKVKAKNDEDGPAIDPEVDTLFRSRRPEVQVLVAEAFGE